MKLVAALLLALFATTAQAVWVRVHEVQWATSLADNGKPNPWVTPMGENGIAVISQVSTPEGIAWRMSFEGPTGRPFNPCQTEYTWFANGVPGHWCDSQILEPTPIEAVHIPDVHRFSEKRLRAIWVVRAGQPLTVRPIMWQWWHLYNYRILNCDNKALTPNTWTIMVCDITMPITKALVGPPTEHYTGMGLNFAGPYSGWLDVLNLWVCVEKPSLQSGDVECPAV